MSSRNIETEVKIEIDGVKKVDEIYAKIGKPAWNIQRNYIYRFDGGILRIRHEKDKAFLTVKGPNQESEFNKRPEAECEIPIAFYFAFSKLRNFLGNPFYYEKSRASVKYGDCIVCLDNLEGRYFVEIEGDEKAIKKNISRLGLKDFPQEKRSYLELLKED